MTSTNGSEPVEPTPRKASATRSPSTSQDPEVLAAEIERTREDLAETLDAIADRVSPKRVSARTRKKVADKVSEVTGQARTAASGAVEAAAGAKDKLVDKAGEAAQAATGGPAAAAARHGSEAVAPEPTTPPTATGVPAGDLPPVAAVQVDHLDLSTAAAPGVTATVPPTGGSVAPAALAGPAVRPEVVAGGVVGLLLLLLLRRRRTRRRDAARTPARPGSRRRR